MFKKFIPDYIFDSAYDLNPEFFRGLGVECVIFDIDNTLVSDGTPEPDERARAYIESFRAAGFKIAIASNNSKDRTERFCSSLDIYFTYKSGKPKRRSINEICSHFNITPAKTAVLGDQILTDMLMAKRAGAKAVLVKPINPYENPLFWFKRAIEKPFIRKYYRKAGKKQL